MFGTGATTAADITLILYVVVLLPLMILGFIFARRKQFDPQHKIVMSLVMLSNWLLIAAVMLRSFGGVAQNITADNITQLPTLLPLIHMVIGGIAQLMATYLVLLMWTEDTRFENIVVYRIKNIKTPMRITLTLWITTIVFGFAIYAVWYDTPLSSTDAPEPVATEEAGEPLATEEATPDVAATEDADAQAVTTEEATPDAVVTEEANTESGATDDSEVVVTEEPTPEIDATEEVDAQAGGESEPEIDTTEEATPEVNATEDVDG